MKYNQFTFMYGIIVKIDLTPYEQIIEYTHFIFDIINKNPFAVIICS